ncbi:MAG: exo-alpha-sialidase [Bacteroidetes bacterium]|nr:exo-alpha-sialidase [Bacteroidota bacterium]MBU1115613.1 exo-alpha-sialidase [Bacteroidota bacterium]MBU1797082.1 exo-alpha-sialidase [Bacteroidota bacterium]
MTRLFLFVLLTLSINLSAQLTEITKFPLQDTSKTHLHSSIVELDGSELLFLWIESSQLKVAKSSDGVNWNTSNVLVDSLADGSTYQDLVTYKTNSGKIIVAYRANQLITEYQIISSTDNGITWSEPTLMIKDPLNIFKTTWDGKFSQTDDNKLWFSFNRSFNLEFISSEDDGATWGGKKTLTTSAKYGSVISTNDSLIFIYSSRGTDLQYKRSNDNGITWSTAATILDDSNIYGEPSVIKKTDGSIMIIYRLSNSLNPGEYNIIESNDNGSTWSTPTQFTKYTGLDLNLRINSNSENLYASFASDRLYNEPNYQIEEEIYSLWYGIVGTSDDIFTPPTITNISHSPTDATTIDTVIFNAKIFDDVSILSVFLHHKLKGVEQTPIEMFDDGLHSDGSANDSTYGISLSGFSAADILNYSIFAADNLGIISKRFGGNILFSISSVNNHYFIDVNRFKFGVDNKGVLADVEINGEPVFGKFDEAVVLFSGGFGLSGYSNGELWANGVMTASRINDYQPGIVGSDIDDPLNMVYVLKSSDEPFGLTWETWKHAVKLGAKFYDGNGDGVYIPIDLNSNGVWDTNEDRPDLIGDVTTWTVYNDGVPTDLRRYDVSPKDIEIQQTVFGYAPNTYSELDGVFFIRYRIENKSLNDYDSVYFASMADADIGDPGDDFAGSDTTINSGFIYNDGEDGTYGINAPTFMASIIQGAPVYIAGETFTDTNSNGIYDEGIDTPLDTANYFDGEFFQKQEFIGAKNQTMSAYVSYMSSHPTYGDPQTQIYFRNYLEGLNSDGIELDPCNWPYGEVLNINCSEVNPLFIYSGNPVTGDGWICNMDIDQRMMVNSGPFILKSKEPVEIIVAYAVGRGNTSLESVDVTKALAKNAIGFYNTNFNYVPVGVKEKPQNQLPTEYSLSQNYPNPFNPSTTIKYSIPKDVRGEKQEVRLMVYDILGREVATLVNKNQKAGIYEVQFDASNLTSGVYFYKLQSGSFMESKKMVLLK